MSLAGVLSGWRAAPRLKRRALVFVASATLFALLSASAFALTRPTDFSPFTMTITDWSATIGTEDGGTEVAGTIVTRLEYRSVRDWTTTIVSHSLDPRYVGSTHTVKDETRSAFDALTRHTFGRIALGEAPEVPDRWLIPGLMRDLPRRGFVASDGPLPGTKSYEKRESIAAPAGRPGEAQSRRMIDVLTRAVFSSDTGLPISVEELVDGRRASLTTYSLTSRP